MPGYILEMPNRDWTPHCIRNPRKVNNPFWTIPYTCWLLGIWIPYFTTCLVSTGTYVCFYLVIMGLHSLVFNRGNTEGTNYSKILFLTFCVYFVICKFLSGLICVFFFFFREFTVWWLVWRVIRRQTEVYFSPDVIFCGWLGSKYKLPNLLSN